MDRMSVLILTYSGNKDVVETFLKFYNKNANGLPTPTVVSDYTINYKHEIICQNPSFSNRLIHALKNLSTKYVLLMLDDYYITEKVTISEIEKCLNLLDKNENLSSTKLIVENGFPKGINKAPLRYSLSLGAGIWKVKDLLLLLKPNESAWDIELKGSYRMWKKKNKIHFPHKSIITYPPGGVVHKGKIPVQFSHLVSEETLNRLSVIYQPESPWKRRINLLLTLIKVEK